MLLHSAHSPLVSTTSFKLPQSVSYSSISFQQVLPILALTDRPPFCMRQNMELFHPVRSCTHLFSMSKTQGLSGVMIGFLLCNLLEFSLSHQQDGTMLSYTCTRTLKGLYTICTGMHTYMCMYACILTENAQCAYINNILYIYSTHAKKRAHARTSYGKHLPPFFCSTAYLCPSVIPLLI